MFAWLRLNKCLTNSLAWLAVQTDCQALHLLSACGALTRCEKYEKSVQFLHVEYCLAGKMIKCFFTCASRRVWTTFWMSGWKVVYWWHCVSAFYVRVCASAYVSVSKSIHANVVLNVNFWSVLFTLVVSVEVPFACNIVRKCCNQPHLLCLLASPFYLHPLCPLFIIKPQLSIWTLYTLTFTQN